MSIETMSECFEMRLAKSVLDEVDTWRARQRDVPSRTEAIRRLVDAGLEADAGPSREVRLTDGEKLILLSLRDLYGQLRLNTEESGLDLMAKAIRGGHPWSFAWFLSDVLSGRADSNATVDEVLDILEMWRLLEIAHERLSAADRHRVAVEGAPFGETVRFRGFDGNNEGEHLGVAEFLIRELGSFEEFKDRDLNSHTQLLDCYRRMLAVFRPISKNLEDRLPDAGEIVAILQAIPYPRHRENIPDGPTTSQIQ